MNWLRKKIDMGTTNVGNRHNIVFIATSELPEIKSMKSSCGCTVPIYDDKNRTVNVVYTAKEFPKHLKNSDWYLASPTILVTFADGSVDILSFTFKIIR